VHLAPSWRPRAEATPAVHSIPREIRRIRAGRMSAHDHIVMNGGRSIIHVSMCDFAGLRLVKVKALNSQRFSLDRES